MAKQGELARSGRGFSLPATTPEQKALAGLTAAHFTDRELLELRRIVRDADSELGVRFLQAALDRAGARPATRAVDEVPR